MITIEQAKNLKHRDILYHVSKKDSRGNPVVCRVNGKVKLWKTRPTEFEVPVKYGLYNCFYVTHLNAKDWTLDVVAPEASK